MTVIKNQKSNTYEVRTYYKDWTGVRKQKTKRGFKRKCDAQEWERAFKLKENLSLDMYFGVRMGELLALTPADFDFQACTIRINKSYQRLEGKDIITDPKTVKSNRMITMPEFLSEELESYIGMLYGLNENDRIFQISKSYLHHEMDRGVKLSGVKRIRIHDLRHSHVSLLINMGYSVVAIGERVGHESVEITYRYAHLFPTIQTEMAENLNQEREEYLDE